jgi:CRISPR-associated protein Cas5d
LGWKEFVPSYFGPFREGIELDQSVDDIMIPAFLSSMWKHRQLKPEYVQDWRVVKGVLSYVHQTPPEGKINAK